MYRKISLLYYIGALNKILFIKLRLKQIKLAKEIFILDIEEGIPVFLPNELKHTNMPLSLKYYDGTLNFLDSEISILTKQKYQFMLESKNSFFQDDDLSNRIYKKLGIVDSHSNEMNKEVIKHEFANNNHNN
jgi:hypothetical protein